MSIRKVYTASSWRNPYYPQIVRAIRALGHQVYDFRYPPGGAEFRFSRIDPNWKNWTLRQYTDYMATHQYAQSGFDQDKGGIEWADTLALINPCGISAHSEFGYAAGLHKDTFVLLHPDRFEPELMYKFATRICPTPYELFAALGMPRGKQGDIPEGVIEQIKQTLGGELTF